MTDKPIKKQSEAKINKLDKKDKIKELSKLLYESLLDGTYINKRKPIPEATRKANEDLNKRKEEILEKYKHLNVSPKDASLIAGYLRSIDNSVDPNYRKKINVETEKNNKYKQMLEEKKKASMAITKKYGYKIPNKSNDKIDEIKKSIKVVSKKIKQSKPSKDEDKDEPNKDETTNEDGTDIDLVSSSDGSDKSESE
jgi:hypothetical protein